MRMLMIRTAGKLRDGRTRRVPIVRDRGREFGPVLNEQVISIKRDLLITGPNASGKSRWLARLEEKGAEVWTSKPRIYLRSLEPIGRWYEDPRVIQLAESKKLTWSKLKAFEKIEAMFCWFAKEKPVLLLDDAHKLTGRKLDIAIRLCRESSILVVAAFEEQSIPMSLRMLLDKRNPQRVSLKSEAAYDVTSVALWLVILASLGAGWWQLAAAVGGMKVLGGGRRASKQS